MSHPAPPSYERLHESDPEESQDDQATNLRITHSVTVEASSASAPATPPPPYVLTKPSWSQIRFPTASNRNQIQNDTQHEEQASASSSLRNPTAVEMMFASRPPARPEVNTTQPGRHDVINVVQMSPEQREGYGTHMLFSCTVFWCCVISGWVFGLTAFILALCASDKSNERGKEREARNCARASITFSTLGVVFGIILTILYLLVIRPATYKTINWLS